MSGNVLAQEPAGEAAEERFWGRVDAGVILDLRSGVETHDPGFQMIQGNWITELDVDLWNELDLTAITRVRADPFDVLEAGVPSQSAIAPGTRRAIVGDRAELELRELYVRASLGPSILTLGKQQIVWGQADGLKVLDVVNPQNFREFILEDFEDSRIPLWTVNAEIPVGSSTVQFVWLPDRSYHELAPPGSAYTFSAPGYSVTPPPGVDAVVEEADRPDGVIADTDLGARLSTFSGGWDLTVNYLYHYDDFPAPFVELELAPEGPLLTVTPSYARSHLFGGTFSKSSGSFVLRGEVGYFFNLPLVAREIVDGKAFLQLDQLRHVIALDWYRFSDSLVSFQLFQDWVPEHEPILFADRVTTSFSVLFRRDLMHQTLTPQVILIHNLDSGSGVARPRITYDVTDRTTVEIGADIFYGDEDSLFGQFAERDRIVMRVTWAY